MTAELDQLSRIGAELDIRNAIVALAEATDEGDLDEYEALLLSDATIDMGGTVTAGAATFVNGMRQRRAEGLTGPGSHSRHLLSTMRVSVTSANEAEAKTVWQFFADTTGAKTLVVMGTYTDRWVRGDQGWRLASRVVAVGP
jgi:3-phenylpropionate/cinnamic acid dioxygenase small subunit